MKDFEFKIDEVVAIGLEGGGQRPMHTNIFGRILKGSIKIGDIVLIPLRDETLKRVAVKWLMVEYRAFEPSPQTLSAEIHGKYICGMSIRLKPNESHLINQNGVIRSKNSEAG